MSYKHVGTAGDLVRFGCALKIECTFCHAARTLNGVDVYQIHGNRQHPTPPPPRMPPLQEEGGESHRAGPGVALRGAEQSAAGVKRRRSIAKRPRVAASLRAQRDRTDVTRIHSA